MKLLLPALLLPSLFFLSPLHSQSVDSMMRIYAERLPQQKAYVHFDKSVYRAGETIWFKAYLFAGYEPALNSKNLFTELIDANGNVIQRKIYPLIQSSAGGYFDLPETAPASQLTFRAYTTWMLNFDTTFIFQRTIDVVGKAGAVAKAKEQPATTVDLHFFPEGGNLVNTLESFVAFKANDNYGMPVYVNGSIKNSKGEVVETFKAAHDGMGIFKITPVFNETYTAYWQDDKGVEHTTPLPAAKAQGIVLNVASVGNKKIYIIKRSDGADANYQNLYVEAHLAGELVYKANVPLVKGFINSGSINTATLPAGVLQLTVFSANWEPLAERVMLVNSNNYTFDVNVNADTSNLNIRAKNVFEIRTSDTALSNLSIAITDAGITNKSNADNIISRMLLTGDIRGYVHNPTYYFSNLSDSVADHLDLVMLTHGWRKYNWDEIARKIMPGLKFPDEGYLSLNAKVYGVTPSYPLRKDERLLAIVDTKDSTKTFMEIPKTGPDAFSLSNMVFFDTIAVHYQFSKDRKMEKRVTVKFDNGMYKGTSKVAVNNIPNSFTADKDSATLSRTKYMAEQLNKYTESWKGKGNVLQNVTVRTKVKSKAEQLDEKYASGLFKGSDAFSFDLTNEPAAIDIFNYLQGRVPGLTIRNNGPDVSISWRGSQTAIFIDEMQADPERLQSISVSDIAYVKVFRPPFFGSFGGGAGGAIAVYTRKGTDIPYEPGKGLLSTQVAGYSYNKEFYSPDYSTRAASSDIVGDYRTTLYWNPYIFLDGSKQSVKIRFFNNDVTKAFRVILEGVNETGKLVHIEKVIQ